MKKLFRSIVQLSMLVIAAVAAVLPLGAWATATARTIDRVMGSALDSFRLQAGTLGANTLTSLIPSIYESLDVVSRELSGFIPAVTMDANASRAAVGQDVIVPVTPAATASDITPGVTAPDDGDQAIGNTKITITKARAVPFRWNGEEQLGLNNGGAGYAAIRNQQIIQAMRTLVNEVEVDLGLLARSSSRAYGTPGTTPFASNLTELSQVRKILVDNGAPAADLQCVIDTTAGASMRSLTQLNKANESGDTTLLRQGILLPVFDMAVRESAGVVQTVAGTGASYVTSGTAAVGATQIVLATGTGTVPAGCVVTFAGDTNQYVVTTGIAAPGTITIASPGLRKALANGVALTVKSAGTANVAFQRSAFVLAARAPALPAEGDAAVDRMVVTDPRSGLSFEVSMYAQYRQVRYELALAWGVANIKSAHSAILFG